MPNMWATPLAYALSGGCRDTVAMLLARGAEVRAHDTRMLGIAVGRNRLDLVQMLLEHGADAGQLPLADPSQNRELAELAIAHGYDVNAGRPAGRRWWLRAGGTKENIPRKYRRYWNLGRM